MSKRKSSNSPSNSALSYLLKPEDYADISSFTKIALPRTLNEYFAPFIENIKDCLLFLERFSDQEEDIKRLLDTYNSNPKLFNKLSDKLDLDLLAKKAGFTTGEFRRLIHATLDYMGDEEAITLLRLNKVPLIKKSLQIAHTDRHPDSFEERKNLMQYYGIYAVPKSAAVNINVDKSVNNSLSQTQIGLPPFSSTISHSEKIASEQIKNLIDLDKEKDIKQLEKGSDFIEMNLDNSSKGEPLIVKPILEEHGLDGFEPDEMEDDDV